MKKVVGVFVFFVLSDLGSAFHADYIGGCYEVV